VAHGHLPHSLPYATAPTSGWHDVTAGAQLIFWLAWTALGGDRGLQLLQACAAAVGFGVLAWGLSQRSSARAARLVPLIALVGAAPDVLVARVSLFSLALFPCLLLLLHQEAQRPSRRIWLAVPLLAAWGNLHGAVLVGVVVTTAYLVLERVRSDPRTAAGVLITSALALGLNPALWQTPLYYRGVFENRAAAEGVGLWAPLGLDPFDVVLVAAAVLLIAFALRGGPRLWEWVVLGGLAVGTVHAARFGLWFLLAACYPAARGLAQRTVRVAPLVVVTTLLVAAAIFALGTGRHEPVLVQRAADMHQPVLADATLAEAVAARGGAVWVANPIDAFRSADQSTYLAWLAGKEAGSAALGHARFVLVDDGSAAGRASAHDQRLALLASAGGVTLYRIR
jgi:hypothetical protein